MIFSPLRFAFRHYAYYAFRADFFEALPFRHAY